MHYPTFRFFVAIISTVVIFTATVQAGPVSIDSTKLTVAPMDSVLDLRLETIQQTMVDVTKFSRANSDETETHQLKTGQALGSGLSMAALDQQPTAGQTRSGSVDAVICDCGEILIAEGGFPKWPLLFLGAIPLAFLHRGNDTPTIIPPTLVLPIPSPTTTPTLSQVPEPASLLLSLTGLLAFGAGFRRRRSAQALSGLHQRTSASDLSTLNTLLGRCRFLIGVLALLCLFGTFSETQARKGKKPNFGTIKVQSDPPGLPLELDGKSLGQTSAETTVIERLAPGVHRIIVRLPDGQLWSQDIDLPAGRIKCIAVSYRPPPIIAPTVCPYIAKISAPTQVSEGEVTTFSTDVAYSGTTPLHYTWTVSPANARILSGAGTPTISVDSTALGGQRIVATVVVDDGSGNPLCRQTVQAVSLVPTTPKRSFVGREFDTCCSCSYDDQKARLDQLAIELQNDPSTSTYVIAYGGRNSRAGEAGRLLDRARNYLATQRGIDLSRITVVNGGFREEDCLEVWVVPRGALPPQPTPTVQAGDVHPRASKSKPR